MAKSKSNHPAGLKYLFFSEMWERFGFYLMLGIFFLYMTDTEKGGMGLPNKEGADIFGTFIALVYLTPFIGGLLADRVLGYRLSITIGGIMMGIGYCGLALDGMTSFYVSLLMIIIGNGFFKPNISTLLGMLYNNDDYKKQKDAGYNIFYMGINIGAFICNFFAAYLRNNHGWGYAFMAAGIGMFIGVIVFWIGSRHYNKLDVIKPANPEDMSIAKVFGVVLLPAFIFGALPVALFYVSLLFSLNKTDRRPVAALLSIFGVVIVFWAIFKQNGTALTTWAKSYTDRELPASIIPVATTLGMVQEIKLEKDTLPVIDEQFRVQRDANGVALMEYTEPSYYKNIPKENWPEEGTTTALVSTEIFQSINPFFVIILTPVVVGIFIFLRRRNKEPSTPGKIFYGLLITAISTLIMVAAVYVTNNGEIKGSAWWLISTYGVITVGELCLSPMGLSLVSKLSPPRITALMMGGWFLSTSIGNKLSGVLAALWDGYENKADFFYVNFIVALASAIAILFMLKWLRTIVKEHSA